MIQEARSRLGISLKKLAATTGRDASYLSRIENGSRVPELDFALRLALELRLDPGQAFLAAARDHLPEELRKHVPDPLSSSLFGAARDHQTLLFDFEVSRHVVSAVLRGDRFHVNRTFENCRPRLTHDGPGLQRMVFREPVPAEPPSGFSVRSVPSGVVFQFHTTREGNRLVHRFDFGSGWKRQPGEEAGFTLDVTSEVLIAEHGPSGVFCMPVVNREDVLTVSVQLPPEVSPKPWSAHCSIIGGEPNATLQYACRDSKFETHEDRAELTVHEPLAGFSFGICWDCGGPNPIATSPVPLSLSL